jgi:chemotaxis protein methyltransferase CheR
VPTQESSLLSVTPITDAEYARFQTFVRESTGINLTDVKKALVVARLGSRVRARQAQTFARYYQILSDPSEGVELQTAIDLITTNETSFFREPAHFELLKDLARENHGPFRIWSAASSSGEEAYSMAMILADVLAQGDWEVVGTDISSRVLERARQGLYPLERSNPIPPAYLKQFCLKGKERYEGMFLVAKPLRERVTFHQVNLCKPLPDLGRFDVVFLRNILIYFELEQKRTVVGSIVKTLKPGGMLITGHSESLNGICDCIAPVRPTVYRAV